MDIVLRKDVESLGSAGSVVHVSAGYARNYLFPRKLAVPATTANMRTVAEEAKREEAKNARTKDKLTAVAAKLSKVAITATVKVGEDDKVFGSVTALNIAELLKEKGHDYDHRAINLKEPIKALGQYDVEVKLGHGVSGSITVWVVKED
ncbi:MAG: 50S ribosomal protein L9 [Candidatus Marinimicrobia bacterium]|nr:50S ribosomal protein L9 [Candidatus Neomarinimicrobiota bacterium]